MSKVFHKRDSSTIIRFHDSLKFELILSFRRNLWNTKNSLWKQGTGVIGLARLLHKYKITPLFGSVIYKQTPQIILQVNLQVSVVWRVR